MKKVNLCITENDSIDGFNNISVAQLDAIPNGSIDNIMINVLNNIEYEQSKSVIVSVLRKLKHKGQATIRILDLLSVSKDIFYGVATSKSVSGILGQKSSFLYEEDILDVVNNFPQFQIKNKHKDQNTLVFVIYKELKNV